MPTNIEEKSIPIGVLIRVRPKSQQQKQSHEVIKITQNRVVQIALNPLSKTIIEFDQAFSENTTQKQFFQPFKDPIRKMIKGYNLTILAYGQTGSGKSHTMFGKDLEHYETLDIKNNQDRNEALEKIQFDQNNAGLIPRAIQQLFQQVKQDSYLTNSSKFSFYCSFLQIYNEKVFDLFQDPQKAKPLQIHQSNVDGTFVEGLTQFNVTNEVDCLKLIKFGRKNVHIRQSAMNAKSSRSHAIFQISLESSQANKQNSIFKKSKLTLCDLAGSQKIVKGEKMKGQHLEELKNINKSLSTLGKVMTSLSSRSKQIFAPFRESKLTRLLQQSLTGNTNTFIIGNISPSELQIQQKMNTLRFVEKARHIVTRVKPVEFDGHNRENVKQLQKQIISLKQFLKLKNKGINPQKIQQKLVDLQEQNQKLRKNNISSRDYQKVIAENQRMREEIHKLKLVRHIKTDNDSSSKKIQKNQTKSEESDQSNQRNGENPFPRKLTEVRKIIKKINNKFRSKSQMKEQKSLSKSHLPQIQPSKRTRQASQPSKIQNKSHLYQPKTNRKEKYSSLPRQLNQNKEKEQIFRQQNNQQSTIRQFLAKNKQTPQFLSLQVENFQNYNLDQQEPKILGNLRNRRRYIRQQKNKQSQQPSIDGLQSQRERKSKIKEKQKILQKLSKFQVVQKMNQQKLFNDLEKIDGKGSIIRLNYHQKNDQHKTDQSRISSEQKSNKNKQRKGHILMRKNDNINFQERIRQLESKLRAK